MMVTRRAMIVCAGFSGVAWLGRDRRIPRVGPTRGTDVIGVARLRSGGPISRMANPSWARASSGPPSTTLILFRSAEHREKFAADPERFAPQYDGYCAGGVSKGYKVEPDPEAWIIANGRLFSCSSSRTFNYPQFRPLRDNSHRRNLELKELLVIYC